MTNEVIDSLIRAAERAKVEVDLPLQEMFFGDRSDEFLDAPYGNNPFMPTPRQLLTESRKKVETLQSGIEWLQSLKNVEEKTHG